MPHSFSPQKKWSTTSKWLNLSALGILARLDITATQWHKLCISQGSFHLRTVSILISLPKIMFAKLRLRNI